MMLRRFAPAPLLALAIFACTPSVPSNPNTVIVTALFDLASSPPVIPLPNDLALQPALNPGLLNPQDAQTELLAYFAAQKGFPPDQVVPLDFPVAVETVNGPKDIVLSAPDIANTALVPCTGPKTPASCNIFLLDLGDVANPVFPAFTASYVASQNGGTIRVTAGTATSPTTWRPGAQFVYALRGGSSGIKTKTGQPLQPSFTSYTLIFGQPSDFVCPPTNPQCPLPLLGLIQNGYLPVYTAIETFGFPLTETVVVGSFPVAPATTWVVADPGTGTVPVHSNFLLDPTTNRVSATAATAFGIPALATLDGFSTTGWPSPRPPGRCWRAPSAAPLTRASTSTSSAGRPQCW